MKRYLTLILFLALGTILTQGFQCASPEFTTAKIAFNNRDYKKALDYIDKEISRNPANEEALILKIQTYYELQKHYNAAALFVDCEKKFKTPEGKAGLESEMLRFSIAAQAYNTAWSYYSSYMKTKDMAYVDSLTTIVNNFIQIEPEFATSIYMIGNINMAVYQNEKKESSIETAIAAFEKFAKADKPNLDFAQKNGLYLNMPRTEMLKAMKNYTAPDKPLITNATTSNPNDSCIIDVVPNGMRKTLIYSQGDFAKKDYKVIGWKVVKDNKVPRTKQDQYINAVTMDVEPYFQFANAYFVKKEPDYIKAANALKAVIIIDPNEQQANEFIVSCYQMAKKPEEALKYVTEIIERFPNNPRYYMKYADMCLQFNKYDEAITNYEKALQFKVDSLNPLIWRNLGATYKNKAAIIQEKQKQAAEAAKTEGKEYKPAPEEYDPYVKQSLELLEKAMNAKFSDDFSLVFDVYELYKATKNEAKATAMLSKMVALETKVPKDNLLDYYGRMLRIYDNLKNDEEVAKWQAKFEQFNNK